MTESLATEAHQNKPSRPVADDLLANFQSDEGKLRSENFGRVALFAIIFMVAGVPLDFLADPALTSKFIIGRVICVTALGILFLLRLAFGGRLANFGLLAAVLPLVTLFWMIDISDGAGSPYIAAVNLVLVGAALLLRWRTAHCVIIVLMCMGNIVAVEWYRSLTMDLEAHFRLNIAGIFYAQNSTVERAIYNNLFFLLFTSVVVTTGTFWLNRQRLREYQLRRELEASKRQAEENNLKLQALNQAKTRFFSNVSHELRTPLTLILSPLENLRRAPGLSRDFDTLEIVTRLEQNGLRMLRMINEQLELGRIEGEAMPELPVRTNLRDFVAGIVGALKATAESKNLTLRSTFETDQGDEGWINRNRVERILLNLAVNAIKFTPEHGRISIEMAVRDKHLRLIVSDTGPGISKEHVKMIFERFWQADMSISRAFGGMGIGLALVKAWTESMGGTIDVKTAPGKGTTFTIALPLVDGDKSVPAPEIQNPSTSDGFAQLDHRALLGVVAEADDSQVADNPAPDAVAALPLVALVVDDEPSMRTFLAEVIDGFKVIQAKNGVEALELAALHKPHIIILDIMMPELDGLAVIRRLRDNPATGRIPILVLTADNGDETRLEALKLGVDDFLTKPFFSVQLLARARNLVKNRVYEADLAANKRALEVAHATLEHTASRLIHSERLSALGRLSAAIVHEVNNPLNYTRTALHSLKSFGDPMAEEEKADFLDVLGDANEGVERVIKTMQELRTFSRGNTSTKENIKLGAVVETARRLVKFYLAGIELEVEVPGDLVVHGNEIQLSQVFMNLIQNAASFVGAAKERGEAPRIEVKGRRDDSGSNIVTVRDNGSGIAEEHLARVFDPFFTHRDAGDGAGLGLCITHQIMVAHGGTVEVNSEQGKYTEFSLCFPALDSIIKGDSEMLESL